MKIAGYPVQPALATPVILGLVLVFLLAVWPMIAPWPETAWFIHLPLFSLLAAAIAGACFTQTRILLLAIPAAATLFCVDHAYFVEHDSAHGAATLLLGSFLLPPLAAVLHRSQERGLLSPYGAIRAMTVLALTGFVIALPLSSGFQQSLLSSPPPSLWTDSGWLRLPGVSLLALLGSLPFLLFKPHGESPRLGTLTGMALIALFLALNFSSSWSPPTHQRATLVLFGTLGGFTLLLAVMETAWRHMNIDELTELPGRRPMKHHLRCLGDAYVLAVVDIDHFKRINDTYGHLAGDQILRYVAAELRKNLQGAAYRYGGEEFVIVYERLAYKDSLNNLDDLRDAISRKEFFLRSKTRSAQKPRAPQQREQETPAIHLTVSIGAAAPSAHYKTPQEVLDAADQALYRAKENGRNRVCHIA
jgi:diguanylate cyclase (GGDEF)-like protein